MSRESAQPGEAAAPAPHIPPVSLDEVVVSGELMSRPLRETDTRAEDEAMESLAGLISGGRALVFKALARLGAKLCNAGSAGISVLETAENGRRIFRWQALAGVIEPYEGGDTPREWSPCGACLDAGKPMLYSYPERYFTYLQALGLPIVEALVIPMFTDGVEGATIWIVSHSASRRFDAEDVRVMNSLGAFAARSLSLHDSDCELAQGDARSGREKVWGAYLTRTGKGDQTGLTDLFKETSPMVFAAALRIVGFRADAEEITADVYSRIWRIARSYDWRRGSVGGWLRSITRSLAFDRLRSSALRTRHETALAPDYCGLTDLEGDLIEDQSQEYLFSAMQALPLEQRRAIEMVYFEGLTCPEIAQRNGEPVGTVKTRIRLGLIKLRRLMAAAI